MKKVKTNVKILSNYADTLASVEHHMKWYSVPHWITHHYCKYTKLSDRKFSTENIHVSTSK